MSVDGVRRAWQIAAEVESSLLPGFLHPLDFETKYAAALDKVDPGLFRVSRFDEPFRCSYVSDLRADVMDRLYQQRDAGISDPCHAFDAHVVDAELPTRLDTQPPGPVDATPIGEETAVRVIEDASGDEDEALDALHERAKAYLAARWLEPLDEKREQAVVDLDARE